MNGKIIRLKQLFQGRNNRTCIVPIDHGATLGAIDGLQNGFDTIGQLVNGGANAVVLHKGMLNKVVEYPELIKGNYLLHLSASTCLGDFQSLKVSVGSVLEGVSMGALGISIHVNLGGQYEPQMLTDFGKIAEECYRYGMPLLAMMYVQGEHRNAEKIAHAARLAQEVGADLVKVDYPGSIEGIQKVVDSTQIPILIAGGSKSNNPEDILVKINDAIIGGASGVSIGRNVFQHPNPQRVTEAICNLIHHDWTLEQCIESMNAELLEL